MIHKIIYSGSTKQPNEIEDHTMSQNNKPKSSVTPVSQHLQNKGNTANPKDVIAAANAQQAAKTAEDQPKAPATTNEPAKAGDTKKEETKSKSYTAKEWENILNEMDEKNLKAKDIAEKYTVKENNVYQKRTQRKKALKEEQAKTGDKDIVATAKVSLSYVDTELKEFDAKVEEAKKLVENATAERKKIEDKKVNYQTIIDMFTEKKEPKKA